MSRISPHLPQAIRSSRMVFQLVAAVLLLFVCSTTCSAAVSVADAAGVGGGADSLPQISIYHRFSWQLKQKAREHGVDWAFPSLPRNTPEYHQWLVRRDLARHGRKLASAPVKSTLAFIDGNLTAESTDGLQYTIIEVGTPKVSHFVALDTGSDLFWLPCECKACAPASSPAFEGLPSLNVYTPSKSSTSKPVACSSTNCATEFSTCTRNDAPSTGQCTYETQYASGNTSTSGTLYTDVVYLTANKGPATNVTSTVVLGCGQIQTGQLVDGSSVPDGLLGLGRSAYSVPSTLAKSGIVGDSFSVCFSADTSGRLVFGDFGGSPNLSSTPFLTQQDGSQPAYFVGVESISVADEVIKVSEAYLFDTGTSLTFLSTKVYQSVLSSFEKKVTYKKTDFGQIFELCYTETDIKNLTIPVISFTFAGGDSLPVTFPIVEVYYVNQTLAGFCLAVLDGGDTSIFAYNFMVDYNFIFDRENAILAFEQSECYNTQTSSSSTVGPAPAPSPVPGGGTSPALSPRLPPGGSPTVPTSPSTSPGGGTGGPSGSRTGDTSAASQTNYSFSLLALLSLLSLLVMCSIQH